MAGEGLVPPVLFRIGPVEITATVGYTLAASGVVVGFALLARWGLRKGPTAWAIVAEFVVEHLEGVMRDMFGRDARPFVPLVVTLALFVGVANLLGLFPGMKSPTADFSATAALAAVVFLAVPVYGIRVKGLKGYLKHYLEPTPFLLPLEIISELSRTVALAVRLFGNIVSEELIIAVLLTIAGLLVPVPIMMLAVLTGVVQAYIFAVLTAVYLSAAVRNKE
jgi:F-type H+-transporting ATPase subunit a